MMTDQTFIGASLGTATEAALHTQITEMLLSGRVVRGELLDNLGLFMPRKHLARVLFITELYRKIIEVHGVMMEFGVRWGQNMALLTQLRGIYEPYNLSRRLIGFDTFDGFPAVAPEDGQADFIKVGAYGVTADYRSFLESLLTAHEALAPISHIKKFELVEGDVTKTLDAYLDAHPETVIAFAYLDLDLYEPTRHVLERILPLMPKGAVIGFDQTAHPGFPGESRAVKEIMTLPRLSLKRMPITSFPCYAVVE